MAWSYIFLVLCIEICRASGWKHASGEELRNAFSQKEPTLVAFTFPTQKRSQMLELEWAALQGGVKDIKITSIDCSVHTATCIHLDATSYPAIRLYQGEDRFYRYRGVPRSSSILSFIRRVSNPVTSSITHETLTAFTNSDDITLTAQFPPQEIPLYEWQYLDLARDHHLEYSFGILPPSSSETGSIIQCRNNIENETYALEELWVVGSMKELLRQCSTPLILEPTRKEISELGQIASRGEKTVIVHYFAGSEQKKDVYREKMRGLVKKHEAGMLFTLIDVNVHPLMPGMAGLEEGITEGLSVENLQRGEIFPYPGSGRDITPEKLGSFLENVLGGRVAPWDGERLERRDHDEL
ncbi:hypothetical protein QBC47DRAFT_439528 [Echria macrotheca]|uniref:Thioredoxin domain-containing protein n=1 Tax=Echria macrotheca TaxID=438768 RepID=A0AAJ0F1C8_9PEZI|nr:hypothetical protein QBC47DRAFT_439528 [Echria macrotheca]